MNESRTPLDPDTPGIRELLADIEGGLVRAGTNTDDILLHFGDGERTRVTDAVIACRVAGWAVNAGGVWSLTSAGLDVLYPEPDVLLDRGEGLLT